MLKKVENGSINQVNGEQRIYYEGHWIRYYDVPNNLAYKKTLIDQLTRRVFHHVETGVNTPGDRLEEVRGAYDAEKDSRKKRVLAAMLAGALLNRGTDILTRVVELEQIGVSVKPDNELLKECGRCFMGALEHGKQIRVKHGREGLEELWGEPFKAFTAPVERFLESRYIKIAQTMTEIDAVVDKMNEVFAAAPMFHKQAQLVVELGCCGKQAMETLRSDPAMIKIWPGFVSASERVADCKPLLAKDATRREQTLGKRGIALFHECGRLIEDLTNLRIPMPNTTHDFVQRCDQFKEKYADRLQRA